MAIKGTSWIQQYGATNTFTTACGADANITITNLNFPIDSELTFKDFHWFLWAYRPMMSLGCLILMVVPDDMVAAITGGLNWGTNTPWLKYEKFIWGKMWFGFGGEVATGRSPTKRWLEFKASTMRRISKDYTLLAIIWVEDINSGAGNCRIGSYYTYKVMEHKGS